MVLPALSSYHLWPNVTIDVTNLMQLLKLEPTSESDMLFVFCDAEEYNCC